MGPVLVAIQRVLDVASRFMLTISVSLLVSCMVVLLLSLVTALLVTRLRGRRDPRRAKYPALPLSELGSRR